MVWKNLPMKKRMLLYAYGMKKYAYEKTSQLYSRKQIKWLCFYIRQSVVIQCFAPFPFYVILLK